MQSQLAFKLDSCTPNQITSLGVVSGSKAAGSSSTDSCTLLALVQASIQEQRWLNLDSSLQQYSLQSETHNRLLGALIAHHYLLTSTSHRHRHCHGLICLELNGNLDDLSVRERERKTFKELLTSPEITSGEADMLLLFRGSCYR